MSINEYITKVTANVRVRMTVKKTSNEEFPYYAECSYKGISGAGETEEDAKQKCEAAVRLDLELHGL